MSEVEQMMRDLSVQGWYITIELPALGGSFECLIGRDEWTTNNLAQARALPRGTDNTIRGAILAAMKNALDLYGDEREMRP